MKRVQATLTNGTAPQFALVRPVCAAVEKGETCVLLSAHTGKHVSSKGRQW